MGNQHPSKRLGGNCAEALPKDMKTRLIGLFTLLGIFLGPSVSRAAEPSSLKQPMNLADVKVGGELRARLERNFQRLHDERYRRESLFTKSHDPKWPGDMEGRTALALTMLAQALDKDEPSIDVLFADFPRFYNSQGYFGPEYLPAAVDEQQLSSHGWVLRALCEYYLWRKNPETRTQIQRIVERLVLPTAGLHKEYPLDPAGREHKGAESGAVVAVKGKWRLSSDIGCDFIFFDGVVQAYAVTGDARLVPVIEELVELFLSMDFIAIKAQTHATLSGTRGLIRWYEACRNPKLLARAEQIFQIYLQEGCSENFENYNWFGRPDWTEPCAIVDSYLIACQLWQHTGKPEYLESAQWIYFNGIAATQRSNGGFGLNNCSGAAEPMLFTKEPEAYWCCTMRGGEGLASAARYSAFTDAEGIWLATFMNSSIKARLPQGVLQLEQVSSYPFGKRTCITVSHAPTVECEIRLFAPSFVTPRGVRVNGETQPWIVDHGFIALRRAWRVGDILEYEFEPQAGPRPLRNVHSLPGYELLHYGPLLLSAYCAEQPAKVTQAQIPLAVRAVGPVEAAGEGHWRAGDLQLTPVYHLMLPALDQSSGSWRQLLFPANYSKQVAKP